MGELFGRRPIRGPLTDPLQAVRLLFLDTGTETEIELIEPLGEDSPVAAFLARGGGLHHLCYLVEDLETSLTRLRAKGCLITSPPKPAVAFEGRRVAFLVTRERQLVELLEHRLPAP